MNLYVVLNKLLLTNGHQIYYMLRQMRRSGSYVRGGALGDAPVSSTTSAHATRPRHTMPASCEVLIGIPI